MLSIVYYDVWSHAPSIPTSYHCCHLFRRCISNDLVYLSKSKDDILLPIKSFMSGLRHSFKQKYVFLDMIMTKNTCLKLFLSMCRVKVWNLRQRVLTVQSKMEWPRERINIFLELK
eukprot:TRINITY_DN10854_c0_g1_i2.p1 TRINITY_DN10854_c0_g1~~TRINITY_DN10854_c0_g1_i2.p1  ORF type:complete len:116 (+),score=2.13 TRINITY_DN10854_c0_g1_i2:1749-2096(+)